MRLAYLAPRTFRAVQVWVIYHHTYVEILHSVIHQRRGGLGEAVSGRKGLGGSMSGGPVVSIGRWDTSQLHLRHILASVWKFE